MLNNLFDLVMISLSEFDLIIAVVAVWFLLTFICVYDYAQYKRDGATGYILAMVFLPVIGIGVSILYLMRRDQFDTRDVWRPELSVVPSGLGCTVQETDGRVIWNCQYPGSKNRRRRLSYAFACKPRTDGVYFIGILVAFSLLGGLQGSPFVFLLFGVVLLFSISNDLSSARTFANITVGIDPNAGVLGVNWHKPEKQLFPGQYIFSSHKNEADLARIETVELVRFDGQYLARLRYQHKRRGRPKLLPVPDEQVTLFSETLSEHGATIEDKTVDDAHDEMITQRVYAGVAKLAAIPLCAVVLWVVG